MATSGPPFRRTALGQPGEDAPVGTFAICLDCGAEIAGWRERLLPIRSGSLAVTEDGAVALHVEREGICEACGGGRAEVRVEARHRSGA
jgi:RNA polymerase-binding transcription factor DksA